MDHPPTRPAAAWLSLGIALLLGSGAGALDVVAREVQGPLLLLMASAFIVAVPRRASAWSIGISVSLGLPLAHLIAMPWGGEAPSWGMLIAVPPTLFAAYAGAVLGRRIDAAASTMPRETLGDRTLAWYRRPANSTVLLLATLAACAILATVPVYATLVARGQPIAWWVTSWWQIATFIGWVALLPALLAVRRRLGGSETAISPAQLVAHAALVIAGAAAHAIIIVGLTRALLVPLGEAGVGSAMRWALAAYFPVDALAYALVLALAHASDRDRIERLAREHTAALSSQLDRARLTALEAQIRPHFLFNALNAAVVLAKRGPAEQAVTVLTSLAELLRYVMNETSENVPLDAELEFVEKYLTIEQVRLGERLRWHVDATDEARHARVPRLVLQPLVENAIRHGIGQQLRSGEIIITAVAQPERLRLTVEDDGPGIGDHSAEGIGLTNTRARLDTMYGESASLTLRARPGGGCIAEIILPGSVGEARSA